MAKKKEIAKINSRWKEKKTSKVFGYGRKHPWCGADSTAKHKLEKSWYDLDFDERN